MFGLERYLGLLSFQHDLNGNRAQFGRVQMQLSFLDALGGQPLLPNTRQALQVAAADAWADPTAVHHPGRRAALLLDAARSSIATSLSQCSAGPAVRPEDIWFAPSVEAARGHALADARGPLALGSVEVAALLDVADQRPGSIVLPVDSCARVDSTALAQEAGAGRAVCLQVANAEVGTIQPRGSLGGLSPVLADATQCIGRITLPSEWTTLWASARDWGGPAGVGILVVRAGHPRPSAAAGAWLGGFPNVPAAVAAATALEVLLPHVAAEHDRARDMVDGIRERVAESVPDVEILGDPSSRLPHIVTFSVLYASGEALATALDRHGFTVASGSACAADHQRPSHVLTAMGAFTGGNIRISLPYGCTQATVDDFLALLPTVVADLRKEAGA